MQEFKRINSHKIKETDDTYKCVNCWKELEHIEAFKFTVCKSSRLFS